MKKQKKMIVRFEYIEPKTEEEKKLQQERVNDAFDILFEETLKYMKSKKKAI